MADDGATSVYPPPPPFYKHFTPENVTAAKAAQAQLNPPQLPDELLFLLPPAPPTSGTYKSFGAPWQVVDRIPSLHELTTDFVQLYPDTLLPSLSLDRAQELRRLSRSMLLNFLELVGILGIAPETSYEKLHSLNTLLVNIHQLINEYRPHQARESLIIMMEEQLERAKRETEENREACRQVEDMVGGLKEYDAGGLLSLGDGKRAVEVSAKEKKEGRDKERDVESWMVLKEMGVGL